MTWQLNKKNKIVYVVILLLVVTSGCTLISKTKNIVSFKCDKFDPVCGQNGITYYNECQAEDYEIEIKYAGACTGKIQTIPYNQEETKK